MSISAGFLSPVGFDAQADPITVDPPGGAVNNRPGDVYWNRPNRCLRRFDGDEWGMLDEAEVAGYLRNPSFQLAGGTTDDVPYWRADRWSSGGVAQTTAPTRGQVSKSGVPVACGQVVTAANGTLRLRPKRPIAMPEAGPTSGSSGSTGLGTHVTVSAWYYAAAAFALTVTPFLVSGSVQPASPDGLFTSPNAVATDLTLGEGAAQATSAFGWYYVEQTFKPPSPAALVWPGLKITGVSSVRTVSVTSFMLRDDTELQRAVWAQRVGGLMGVW